MSKLSRRSVVAGAASLPALAAGTAAVAASALAEPGDHPDWILLTRLPASGDTSRAASITRAEYIVHRLTTYGIPFDQERAALFLENMQTFDEDDGNDPRFTEVLAWMRDHHQSLDWLFIGDPTRSIISPEMARAQS